MGDVKNAYKIVVVKAEEKRPIGGLRHNYPPIYAYNFQVVSDFPIKILYAILIHIKHAKCSAHLISLDFITVIRSS